MGNKTDARGKLDDAPFAFTETKDGKVFISWMGNRVTILQGKQAEQFLKRVRGADARQAQLIMAKATGNFKRGNEKAAKRT